MNKTPSTMFANPNGRSLNAPKQPHEGAFRTRIPSNPKPTKVTPKTPHANAAAGRKLGMSKQQRGQQFSKCGHPNHGSAPVATDGSGQALTQSVGLGKLCERGVHEDASYDRVSDRHGVGRKLWRSDCVHHRLRALG